MRKAAAPSPSCPRCGYDQSGAVAAWKDYCPLAGRCTECGLDFRWSDVLNPRLRVPPWSFEYAQEGVLLRAAATWWRALRPRRLWRTGGLRLEHPIMRARLIVYAGLCLLATHIGLGALAAWGTHVLLGSWGPRAGVPWRWDWVLKAAAWPYRADAWTTFLPANHWSALAAVWMLLCPLPFLVLRQTFRQTRCRPAHLLRVWACSLSALPVIVLVPAAAVVAGMALGWGGPVGRALLWFTDGKYIPIAAGVWLYWFWRSAAQRYLRFPHSRAVAGLMMLAALLGALALVAYCPGSGLLMDIGWWWARMSYL